VKTQINLGSSANLIFALFLTVLITGGCSTENAQSPTTVGQSDMSIESLVANPVTVSAGDSTYIYARVVRGEESPEPAVGVPVRFGKVGHLYEGTFSADAEVTDSEGRIVAIYQPIEAEVGPVDLKVIASDTVIRYVSILVTPPSAGPDVPLSVEITGVESSIPADGASTTDLTITVMRDGRPSANEVVILAAGELFNDKDHNGVYDDTDDILGDGRTVGVWDAIGQIPASVTTGSDGTATATYTADDETGEVFIKATIGDVWFDYVISLHGEEAELLLEVMPSEMPANGLHNATIKATVIDWQGQPIQGKMVRFTAGEPFNDVDGDGYFTPENDTFTDANDNGQWDVMGEIYSYAVTSGSGVAAAFYLSGREPGEVTIYASTQDQRVSTKLTLMELPRVNTATWTWSPEWIYANGTSKATLSMRLQDVNGSLIGGKEIIFVAGEAFTDTNGNGRFDSGVDQLGTELISNGTWDELGEIEESVISDLNANIFTDYIASETAGEIIVKASTEHWSLDIPLEVRPLPAVLSMNVSADPRELYIAGSSGMDYTTISATCYEDILGTEVPAGVPVIYTMVSGPGGGAGFGAAGETAVTVKTGENGVAAATFKAGTNPGPIVITVKSGDTQKTVNLNISNTIQMMILDATPTQLNVLGSGGSDHSLLRAACYLSHSVPAPEGQAVTFTLVSGPGGGEELVEGDPAEAVTNQEGVASVTLRSGSISGPVEVLVAAGNVTQTHYLGISAGPPAGISCSADSVAIAYGQTTPVVAVVYDQYHNPVRDGVVVVFTADAGMIYTEDATGATETSGGLASAIFRAPDQSEDLPEIATITCRIDSDLICTTMVGLPTETQNEEPGSISHIELELSHNEIAVRETGGVEQCLVIATCYDKDNRLVGRDREVTFEIVAGPDGGEMLQEAGWGPVTIMTNDTSEALITLTSGTVSGTVRMEASADSVDSAQSALVSISAGPPVYISVGIEPLNIRGWDVVGAEATLIAIVSDIYNNPVRDDTVVYFTVDEGIIRGNYEVTGQLGSCITVGGLAYGTYFSGSPRDDGRVNVTVSTSGGDVIGTGFLLSSGPPTSVQYYSPAPPVSVVADDDVTKEIWVEVLDINNNYVVEGTEVRWTTNLGTVTETSETANGVHGSISMNEFISSTLEEDYSPVSPDDGIGGVATVWAMAGLGGAAADFLEINMLTGPAYRHNCVIEMDSSVPLATAVPVDVVIQDRFGNPLGGHALTLTSTQGLITATAVTDRYGYASNLTFLAPGDTADIVIVVTDTDPDYGGITISKTISVP
jgi:hypothetical protein